MKICPICGLEYSDKAEFCKKCEVVLIEKPEVKEDIPTDYKRLFLIILYTFIFIGFIGLLYWTLGKLMF